MTDGPTPRDDRRGITRRRLLASTSVLLGGSAATTGSTGAVFQDQDAASGTVQIDAPWELNYVIQDNTDDVSGNKASYTIQYQVEWLADFARLDLTVTNTTDGTTPLQDSSTNEEDTFSFSENNGDGDTYEFTFEIYDADGFVDDHVVTDVAGGDGKSQGDLGSVDSPSLDSFYVTDRTGGNKARYTVDYELSNSASNFDRVEVFFDNQQKNQADDTKSSNDQPTGSVDYDSQQGNTAGHVYEITVDVYNGNGVVVDSGMVEDEAGDGKDSSWP